MSTENSMTEDNSNKVESTDYLEKFGYRQYQGERTGKWTRILNFMRFEVVSTWDKSTFGKVILIIVLLINALGVIFSAFGGTSNVPTEAKRNALNSFVATYIVVGLNPVVAGLQVAGGLSIGVGIFIIILFAIAGSGFFADDKQGKVIEIYLSRTSKSNYIISKIGGMIVYVNIFLALPLLLVGGLQVQSYGLNHLQLLDFYGGIILFSLVSSLILSLGILVLSSLVEKRQYASLGFFLIYFLASSITPTFYLNNPDNELLLLISPSILLVLTAYLCLGDFNLGLNRGLFSPEGVTPLVLNDGVGLEWYHIILVLLAYVVVLGGILTYKIQKLTTEEL